MESFILHTASASGLMHHSKRTGLYVRKTNKIHTFLNNLFHLIYPRHGPNKYFFHHQEEFCTSCLKYFTMLKSY